MIPFCFADTQKADAKSSDVGSDESQIGPNSPYSGVRFVGDRRIFSEFVCSWSLERRGIEALVAICVTLIAIAIFRYKASRCSVDMFEKSDCHSGALKT